MNFAEAAHEVVSWVGSHPTDAAIWAGIGALGVVLATMRYKEYRQERREVEEILNRAPHPKPIKLPLLKSDIKSGPR